jgi:hypothetical protein
VCRRPSASLPSSPRWRARRRSQVPLPACARFCRSSGRAGCAHSLVCAASSLGVSVVVEFWSSGRGPGFGDRGVEPAGAAIRALLRAFVGGSVAMACRCERRCPQIWSWGNRLPTTGRRSRASPAIETRGRSP